MNKEITAKYLGASPARPVPYGGFGLTVREDLAKDFAVAILGRAEGEIDPETLISEAFTLAEFFLDAAVIHRNGDAS